MGIYIFSFIILMLIAVMYIANILISFTADTSNFDKLSGYECGFEPIGDARMKFEILYYVVGILYLIFDLEVIFLFPLATILPSLDSLLAFWFVTIFFLIVSIGFIYEYCIGALNFETSVA